MGVHFFYAFLANLDYYDYICDMKTDEVIKIATTMGLDYNPERNFEDNEKHGYIVFDGINGQRFAIDVPNMCDADIYESLGSALRLMGRRELKMELHNLLNITSDA